MHSPARRRRLRRFSGWPSRAASSWARVSTVLTGQPRRQRSGTDHPLSEHHRGGHPRVRSSRRASSRGPPRHRRRPDGRRRGPFGPTHRSGARGPGAGGGGRESNAQIARRLFIGVTTVTPRRTCSAIGARTRAIRSRRSASPTCPSAPTASRATDRRVQPASMISAPTWPSTVAKDESPAGLGRVTATRPRPRRAASSLYAA